MTEPVERFKVESLLQSGSGARVMRPQLRTVDVHWHDYYELSLVTSGEAEHVVNGDERRIQKGSAFLLSPADVHSIRAVGPTPLGCYNIVLHAKVVERPLAALGPPAVAGLPWQTDDFLVAEPDFRRLQAELEDPGFGSACLVDSLVGCLVVELGRRRDPDRHGQTSLPGSEEALRAAVLYVDRHFREPMTLADAAAQAHLSPNYFSERFHQLTGTSFQRYLQERRLAFARSLLASTSLTVTDICHAAGFNDLSHFGRAFRRRYGASPTQGRAPTSQHVTQTTGSD